MASVFQHNITYVGIKTSVVGATDFLTANISLISWVAPGDKVFSLYLSFQLTKSGFFSTAACQGTIVSKITKKKAWQA